MHFFAMWKQERFFLKNPVLKKWILHFIILTKNNIIADPSKDKSSVYWRFHHEKDVNVWMSHRYQEVLEGYVQSFLSTSHMLSFELYAYRFTEYMIDKRKPSILQLTTVIDKCIVLFWLGKGCTAVPGKRTEIGKCFTGQWLNNCGESTHPCLVDTSFKIIKEYLVRLK